MSRSYRKHPIIKDGGISHKCMKQVANRSVRNYKEYIPDGKFYRKIFNPYDVCDWKDRTSIYQWRAEQESLRKKDMNLPKEWNQSYYCVSYLSYPFEQECDKRWYTVTNNSLRWAEEENLDWWKKTYYWK